MVSNNYDDIYKVIKALKNSLKLNENLESSYKATRESVQNLEKALKKMYDPFDASMKLLKSELVLVEEMRKMRERLSDIDYLMDYKDFSIIIEAYDFAKLSKIMKDSFGQIDWSQAVSVDEITEEVAEQYIEEELIEQAQTDRKDSNVQNIQIDKREIKKDIREIISIWISIFNLLFAIYSFINAKPTVVNNTYNNITEVNYNYTIDVGIDAEVLNALGYRIINQNNVMPRIKPDCSSKVTGHLYIGQVVNISDKHKKWIEITWKNNNGEYCSGWVQNYKVSEFR